MDYPDRLKFQETLGYYFNHVDLLTEALSVDVSSERFPRKNYERLKFMGEHVLKLVISEYVLQTSRISEHEGKLTLKRIDLINNAVLKEIGNNVLYLHKLKYLQINPGNPLSHFVKALFGAVFIDSGESGVNTCLQLFCKHWKSYVTPSSLKTLQECFQVPDKIIQLWHSRKVLNSPSLTRLQTRLQYQFKNTEFLQQAITHKSFYYSKIDDNCVRNVRLPDYQRLEFLGDAVLELVVAHLFYENHNVSGTCLVNNTTAVIGRTKQTQIAKKLLLFVYVMKSLKWNRFHDIVESIIGGMYVDGGIAPVREFIKRTWEIQNCPESDPESDLEKLQVKLNYRFNDERILAIARTHPAAYPEIKAPFDRLKLKGEQSIRLIATEYAIRHQSLDIQNAGINELVNNLCSESTVHEIAINLNLVGCVIAKSNPMFNRYELFIWALVGAVFEDSKNIDIVVQLFYRLWNKFLSPVRTLEDSFPSCHDNQIKLRTQNAPECYVNESDIVAIEEFLSYTFRNRNLIEQALASEECKSFFSAETCDKLFAIGFRAITLECNDDEQMIFILAHLSSNRDLFSKHFVFDLNKQIENKDYLHAFICICLIGAIYVDSNGQICLTTVKNLLVKSRSADFQQLTRDKANECFLLLKYKMESGQHHLDLFKRNEETVVGSTGKTVQVAIVKPMTSLIKSDSHTHLADTGTAFETNECNEVIEYQLIEELGLELDNYNRRLEQQRIFQENCKRQEELELHRKIQKERKHQQWLERQEIQKEFERQEQLEHQQKFQTLRLQRHEWLYKYQRKHSHQKSMECLEKLKEILEQMKHHQTIMEKREPQEEIKRSWKTQRERKERCKRKIQGDRDRHEHLERQRKLLEQRQHLDRWERQLKIHEDYERYKELERQRSIQEERQRKIQEERQAAVFEFIFVIFMVMVVVILVYRQVFMVALLSLVITVTLLMVIFARREIVIENISITQLFDCLIGFGLSMIYMILLTVAVIKGQLELPQRLHRYRRHWL